jgi:membrane associated rhomboid family serine protease
VEVIPHPALLPWWSILGLIALLGVSLVRRQPWLRGLLLGFSSVWFALVTCYVASFAVSEHPRDIKFIEEIGWLYFVQLLVAASLPCVAILKFGKRSRRSELQAFGRPHTESR